MRRTSVDVDPIGLLDVLVEALNELVHLFIALISDALHYSLGILAFRVRIDAPVDVLLPLSLTLIAASIRAFASREQLLVGNLLFTVRAVGTTPELTHL